MLEQIPILALITASPLLGVLILLLISSQKGRWIKIAAIAAASVPLLLSLVLYVAFDHETAEVQFAESHTWIEVPIYTGSSGQDGASDAFAIRWQAGVDGISAALVLMTALITFLATLAAVHIKKRWKAFYIWLLLMEVGMLGVFVARDVFLFFICFEITLVPLYFLIAVWGLAQRKQAANTFLLYNGAGSAILLLALIVLVQQAGYDPATNVYSGAYDIILQHLQGSSVLSTGMQTGLFIALLLAFAVKFPLFPFHTWMVKVHQQAPAAVVMVHAGILLKIGSYGLIRYGIALFPEAAYRLALLLAVLGVINVLYGALAALVQTEFRSLLAYASISHMGIVLLGIAAFNNAGLQGAVFQMVSHGLIAALLFLIIGSIYERTQTTQLDQLGGLARSMPFLCGIFLTAGFAMIGVPGMSGFVSEFLAFLGLFETRPWLAALAATGIIFTAVYVLRGVLKVTFGPWKAPAAQLRDARFIEAFPMITLLAVILLLGIYPAVLSEVIQPSILQFVTRLGG